MADVLIAVVGMLLGILLFYGLPSPDGRRSAGLRPRISIIIPVRNEETTIPLLLADLMAQTVAIHEILCIDDASTDRTAETIHRFGMEPISAGMKPDGWIGKSWACHVGAERATGDLFLFLDADVRLEPDAVEELMASYQTHGGVISIQPYHRVLRMYEQLSLFFNLIQIAGNGLGKCFRANQIGLFGPVILIGRDDYRFIDGHECARSCIADDLALGERLRKRGIRFHLFLGNRNISYRMYATGWKDLLLGWTKNFATGASKTPPLTFLAVFAAITSCATVPVQIVSELLGHRPVHAMAWLGGYGIWVILLMIGARRAGSYTKVAVMAYPVLLMTFLSVFVVSIFKRAFRRDVIWKDRSIGVGG
jgi:4,4'-diaponeurosporenoate glycosyltransferase